MAVNLELSIKEHNKLVPFRFRYRISHFVSINPFHRDHTRIFTSRNFHSYLLLQLSSKWPFSLPCFLSRNMKFNQRWSATPSILEISRATPTVTIPTFIFRMYHQSLKIGTLRSPPRRSPVPTCTRIASRTKDSTHSRRTMATHNAPRVLSQQSFGTVQSVATALTGGGRTFVKPAVTRSAVLARRRKLERACLARCGPHWSRSSF